jgi:hypothetical protein
MPYDWSVGLVPDHLGFRKPQRRADSDDAEPAQQILAPAVRPAPRIRQLGSEPETAGPSAPLAAAHSPRDEDAAAGEPAITVPPPRHDPVAVANAGSPAAPLSAAADPAPPNPPAAPASLGDHRAEHLRWRHACNWLALYRLCHRTRCRHAGRCRGDPMACLQAGVARAPQPVRDFVLGMMQAQELGLSVEEALEDTAGIEAYEAWTAGLQAVGKR